MSTPAPATIIGGPVSPYVRKVLAACEMKGVAYQLDPIIPFFGGEQFSELNPLRRIPVFIDDKVSISDSTVICEYLEERYPSPRLLPSDLAQRAQARWVEEFADTRIGDVFIWRIFNEAVVSPLVWQRKRNLELIAKFVGEELPDVMESLERLAPADGFMFGEATIADIAVAAFFPNLRWARVELDRTRWPKSAAWVDRINALPAVAKVNGFADPLTRTPPDQHRAVLAKLGVGLTPISVGGDTPRRGPMTP